MSAEKPIKVTPGQRAAARLLVKREREGKLTIPISARVREIGEVAESEINSATA